MSEFSPKRFLSAVGIFLFAAAASAATPSSRYETRMAYEPTGKRIVMFGGLTATDTGTKVPYYLNDTWAWNSAKWSQLYPQHSPSGRSGHVMVWDSNRNHIVLFGGYDGANLNDTWYFNGADWVQINTPNSPPGRVLAGGAFDPLRDRLVIFGGIQTATTPGTTLTTSTSIYDTWEFDGTTWKQIGGTGPTVIKPMLVYDQARNQIVMLGMDSKSNTLMYTYDANAGTWNQVKPATLPSCVNEGVLVYDEADQKPLFTSGVCSGSTSADDETLEWDGTTWTKLTPTLNAVREFGSAGAYDIAHDQVVLFGGTQVGLTPGNLTYVYTPGTGWTTVVDNSTPGARSLFTFTTDPVNNAIWLFGGYQEGAAAFDFWKFQNGQWQLGTASTNAPDTTCLTPNAAFDTNRQKLVVVCSSGATFEFDGTNWTSFASLKTVPTARNWSSMTYDQTLNKTVLFGGYNNGAYSDETWVWDGTSWNRVKNNPPPSREGTSMWWDPNLKKTVIYGGVGRITSTDRITYYDDMWTFDGNGWTQLTPASGTPFRRYGAEIGVDPRTNHLILFGGIRIDTNPPVPPVTVPQDVAVYAGDTWSWDGTAWTKLATDGVPPPRENGGLAWDPTLKTMVLYGGYAGHYFSDMWTFTDNAWRLRAEAPGSRRRAIAGH